MNITTSAIGTIALLASVSSSNIPAYNVPNYLVSNSFTINETQKSIQLKTLNAWEQASSAFPELRGFSKAESIAYKSSLEKLFHKTGRKLF